MMSTSQTVVWPDDTPLAGDAALDRATPPLSPHPCAVVCGGLTKLFSEKRGEAE